MAKPRRRRKVKKILIMYDDGEVRRNYVSKAPSELRPELNRVQESIRIVLRILSRLYRTRHPVIVTSRFQLLNGLRSLTLTEMSDEEVAAEIARLSYLMEDTLGLLNKLEHSRTKHLEEARFTLTYGQTPQKRDPAGSYGAGLEKDDETED